MKQQKSLKKNFIMNAFLTSSKFIFPLITFPYSSRVLLPAGMGKVSFATSVIAYFTRLAQLGIPVYGVRACAKVRDDKTRLTRTAHELLLINLIMSALSYLLLFLALTFVPRLQEDKTLFVVVSATVLLSSIGMEWLYKALEQYSYITIRSVAFKAIGVIAMFLLVRSRADYVIYGGITIFATSASNIMNLLHAHRYIGFRPVGGYNLRQHLKPVAIFFAMASATVIYTRLDEVMLGFMTTDTDVGYYHAAIRVKQILVSIVTSLSAVLLPRAAYYLEQGNTEGFQRITKKSLDFVFFAATPMAVYFILFARHGVLLLSGSAFLPAVRPMQVIMPTLLIIGIANMLSMQILVPSGRETVVLRSRMTGAAVDLVLNALLIPRMQATGAAIGTLVAELVVMAMQYRTLQQEVGELFRRVHYLRIVCGVAIAGALSVPFCFSGLSSLVTLLLSSVVFFGSYAVFMLIRKDEMVLEIVRSVRRVFTRK